ncbi:hypothetical protein BHE74_00024747 [Ensete ventricosum]|nr:hypothetical protein GW17_00056139 [Ensete ventricosum]RWW67768.1 hypothetical protein BHE74_00024747 [Ensete ventricosum]RZR85281.1 hypothetical protein BHM03_00012230 [Ensete ventricosum]
MRRRPISLPHKDGGDCTASLMRWQPLPTWPMLRRRLAATAHTTVPYSNTASSGKCYDTTWHSHRCHIATSDAMWRTHRHHAKPRATWHQRMTITTHYDVSKI